MEGFFTFLLFVFLAMAALLLFIVVYIYKGIQFTLTATNLYKKILNREDVIVKLLLDIRDNTKIAKIEDLNHLDENITSSTNKADSIVDSGDESPTCPVCKGKNTYFDHKQNVFCRDCRKTNVFNEGEVKSIEKLKALKEKLLQEKKDLEDKEAHGKTIDL